MLRTRILKVCLVALAAAVASGPPTASAGVKIGKFQKKLVNGTLVGGAAGSAFIGVGGPPAWAEGALLGAAYVTVDNHARKKWSGGGWKNWNKPKHW